MSPNTNSLASRTIFVMGVSGCGKSTVGKMLAESLGNPFFDGDDYHPEANIIKMASGTPLNDDDRMSWLETLSQLGRSIGPCVIACSALKAIYRDTLRQTGDVLFVHLHGSKEVLTARLAERATTTNHFMPTKLLNSQLDTLEDPSREGDVIVADITISPDEIVHKIVTS